MASEISTNDTVKPRVSIQSATESSSSQMQEDDAELVPRKPRQRRHSRRARLEALNSGKEWNPDDPEGVNTEDDTPDEIGPRRETPQRRHSRKSRLAALNSGREFNPDDPEPPSSPQEDAPSELPQIVPKKRPKRHSRRAHLAALQSGIAFDPDDSDDEDITPFEPDMHDNTLHDFASNQESAPSRDSSPRNHTESTASTNVSGYIRKRSSMVQSIRAAGKKVPKNLRKWPRCHACCFGVLIPLNVIIVLSLVGGLFLGFLEMKEELNTNDLAMRQQMAGSDIEQDLETVFVDQLPQVCLGLFQANVSSTNFNNVFEGMVANQTLVETYIGATTRNTTDDTTTQQQHTIPHGKTLQEMSLFFSECAQAAGSFRQEFLSIFQGTEDAGALTFNFIRCVNRSSPLAYNVKMWPTEQDVEDALYDSQAQLYADSWKISQQKLQEKYLEESEDGTTQLQALTQSYEDATGEQYCAVNVPSSAWFWFTVMSTSGYGNQPPKTAMGRFFTCVLGFVTIIMFGGMLGTAGGIISHIMTDCLQRCKRNISSIKMIALWGVLWLLWMLVISYQTMAYKEVRLQWDDFPLGDAYWFSFISTTTVGLGDIYFEPEGLFVSDLLGLWANFLVGFCALSAFLNELSILVFSVAPDIVGDLQRNLKYASDWHDGDPSIADQDPSTHGIHRTASQEYKRRNPVMTNITPVMRRTTTNDSIGLRRQSTNNSLSSIRSKVTRQSTNNSLSSIRSKVTKPTILGNNDRTSSAPASFTAYQDESGDKQPLQRTLSSATENSDKQKPKTLLSGLQKRQQSPPPQAPALQRKVEPAKPPQPQQTNLPPGLQRKQQPTQPLPALQRQLQPAKPSQQKHPVQPPGSQRKTEPAKPPEQQNSNRLPGLQRQQQPTQPAGLQGKMEPTMLSKQQQVPALQKKQQLPPPQPLQHVATPQPQKETNPPQGIPAPPPPPPPPQQPQKTRLPQWPPTKKQKSRFPQWPPPKKQPPESSQQKQPLAKSPQQPSAAPTKQQTTKPPPQQQQLAKPPQQTPTQKIVTFVNTGLDPAMAKAELYFQTTRWGPLGHEDSPISVSTNTGDQWYIVANGIYVKVFKIGEGSQQQQFTI